MLTSFWQWLASNAATVGVLLGAVPTIWAIVQFILNKRAEAERQQFETYHSLIKQLVEREDPNQPLKLDRQIAIIFELRNFKRYYPVTLRIFKGLKQDWAEYGPELKRSRLQEELDLAIEFIGRKV
ncbi:MAG: hypothetical protein KF796_07375 [Ramlibacter sp.]|nr:hypothetical protein [Ramlibacter sp.]